MFFSIIMGSQPKFHKNILFYGRLMYFLFIFLHFSVLLNHIKVCAEDAKKLFHHQSFFLVNKIYFHILQIFCFRKMILYNVWILLNNFRRQKS